jgi:hypothetical protein
MYYYTYLLTNVNNGMQYIGKRQCKCIPEEDISYMSSSKYVPKKDCVKQILQVFTSNEEAVLDEIRLHALHDVGINPKFYNKSKQTSVKFDTTGFRFNLTAEQRNKLSQSSKGTPKTLTDEQRAANKARLATYRTSEVRKKAAESLKKNGSNKGIKNSQFTSWYISTPTVTHLFVDISKNEKSLQDGFKDKKHYSKLQQKLTTNGAKHSIYGNIAAIGKLPTQYKI